MGYQIVGKQEINGVGERLGEKIKKGQKGILKSLGKLERSCIDCSMFNIKAFWKTEIFFCSRKHVFLAIYLIMYYKNVRNVIVLNSKYII